MKLVLGGAQFGLNYGLARKKINLQQIKKIESFAYKQKLRIIDTSANYGESEKVIGKNFSKKLRIITKIKIPALKKKNLENWFSEEITSSLKNLSVNKIYGLLIHDYKDLLGKRGKRYLNLLLDLKKRNIVKKLGVSIYDSEELNKIYNFFKPEIVQAPFNILDRRLEDSGWLKKLKESKVEIYVRSCFLQGLLINYNKNMEVKKKFFNYKNLLEFWFDWCRNNKITPLNACLAFIKQHKNINYVVIGFDNLKQLKEIVKNFNKKSILIPDIFKSSDLNLIDPRKWYKY